MRIVVYRLHVTTALDASSDPSALTFRTRSSTGAFIAVDSGIGLKSSPSRDSALNLALECTRFGGAS